MTYSRDFNRFSLVGRFFNRGVDTKKHDISPNQSQTIFSTYVSISFLSVVPLMSCFQASWVSKMISVAYFLFLASPLKAKTFSGFPSGILQIRNHSFVARIRPGRCFSTSSTSIVSRQSIGVSQAASCTIDSYHSTWKPKDR